MDIVSTSRVPRDRTRPARELYAKPRLYISYDAADDGMKDAPVHILVDRYDAQSLVAAIRTDGTLAKILTDLGIPEDTRVTFSRKAGCSCGCSPGLIVNERVSYKAEDYFVTVGFADEIAKVSPWREASKALRARKMGHTLLRTFRNSGDKVAEIRNLKFA